MKNSLKDQIISQDKFGTSINFQFNKNESHKTIFGGIVSILLNLLSLYIILLFGQQLIARNKPQIISSEESVQSPEKFQFTNQSFTFAFGLQNPVNNTHYVNPTIYQANAYVVIYKKIFNVTLQKYMQGQQKVKINISQCRTEQFQVEGTKSHFQSVGLLENFYCFDQTSDQIYIEGDIVAENFAKINIDFQQCKNKTIEEQKQMKIKGQEIITCQSQEIIDYQLKQAQLSMMFTDKIINVGDYNQPFVSNVRSLFWPISNKIGKQLTFNMRNIYIESDIGLFTEQKDIKRSTVYSFNTEQVTNISQTFITLSLRMEKQKQTRIYRQYQKVSEILAQVGGLINVFIILCKFICTPINKIHLNKEIMNSIFQFNSLKNEEKQQSNQEEEQTDQYKFSIFKKQKNGVQLEKEGDNKKIKQKNVCLRKDNTFGSQSIELSNLKKKSAQNKKLHKILKNYNKDQNNQEYFESIIKKQEKETQLNSLSMYDYLISSFFSCKKHIKQKYSQIEYAKKLLNEHIDIQYIIKKLIEVEKLKFVLLNENQLNLFNFLPKPQISKNQIDQKLEINPQLQAQDIERLNSFQIENQSQSHKLLQAYKSYNNIQNNVQKSEVDTKLMNLICPQLFMYLNEEKNINNDEEVSFYNIQIQQSGEKRRKKTTSEVQNKTIFEITNKIPSLDLKNVSVSRLNQAKILV